MCEQTAITRYLLFLCSAVQLGSWLTNGVLLSVDTYSMYPGLFHWLFHFITSTCPYLSAPVKYVWPVMLCNSAPFQRPSYISICINLYPVGPKPVYNQFYHLNPSVSKQSAASIPNLCASKAYTVFKQSFVHRMEWSEPKFVCRPSTSSPSWNQGCTQSKDPMKTSRPISLPHVQSQCKSSL